MVTPYFSARCRQVKCNANSKIPAPRKILENQTFEKFDFWNQTSGKFPNYLTEPKIKPLDPVWAIYSNIYPKRGLIGLIIMDPNDRPEICPLSRRLKGQIFDFSAREKVGSFKRLRSALHINLTTPVEGV